MGLLKDRLFSAHSYLTGDRRWPRVAGAVKTAGLRAYYMAITGAGQETLSIGADAAQVAAEVGVKLGRAASLGTGAGDVKFAIDAGFFGIGYFFGCR